MHHERSNEQKLVDYCFEFAILGATYLQGKDTEEIAEWVRGNLKELGFHTRPMGMSHGVLYTPAPQVEKKGITIVEAGRPE